LWPDERQDAAAATLPASAEQSSVSESDLRMWSDEWKGQVAEISNLLRALKSGLRVGLVGDELTRSCDSWMRMLEELGERVQALTKPFFAHACYVSAINVIRTFQLLCAQAIKFVDGSLSQGKDVEITSETLRGSLAKVAREVDAMVTVLNYNVPTLAVRNRNVSGEIGAGGGWKRRGEMSNQGAALKMVLTKNEASKKFLGRRNVNLPNSPVAAVSSATPPPAESSPVAAPSPSGESGELPMPAAKSPKHPTLTGLSPATTRRASRGGADWEDGDD
jgi:hypothetical protein